MPKYSIVFCKNMVMTMGDPKGVIVNYHLAYTKEALVMIPSIKSKKEAGRLIGKKAIFTDEKGKKFIGKVSGLHGKSGTIKVKFRKPLPSKALAKSINIAE
jgi:ribosomal protein L35AE/L33A